MVPSLPSAADLSLQHVIENSLAIVEREPFAEDQRHQILTNLTMILDQASRGSRALQTNQLAFDAEEQPAFERFTMLFRYLQPVAADVPSFLVKAKTDLEKIRDNQNQDAESKAEALKFLRSLLEAVMTDQCLKPLISPREYVFS